MLALAMEWSNRFHIPYIHICMVDWLLYFRVSRDLWLTNNIADFFIYLLSLPQHSVIWPLQLHTHTRVSYTLTCVTFHHQLVLYTTKIPAHLRKGYEQLREHVPQIVDISTPSGRQFNEFSYRPAAVYIRNGSVRVSFQRTLGKLCIQWHADIRNHYIRIANSQFI